MVELVEEEDEDEEEEGGEDAFELSVLGSVDPVSVVVVLEEPELELVEVLETVEVSVVVVLCVSEPVLAGPWGPLGASAPSAVGASWPPSPIAVRPPPASADSAARRAQRRGTLIGVLLDPSSSLSGYRPLAEAPLTFLPAGIAVANHNPSSGS